MGYSHYYYATGRNVDEWVAAWPKLIGDARLVLEASDVDLVGYSFTEEDPANPVPPIVDIDKGIAFNGAADEGSQPFLLQREGGQPWVKTSRKPYDIAIACILLRAYFLAPNSFAVKSDGYWNEREWLNARKLYQDLWPGEPIWCPWVQSETEKNFVESGIDAKATLAALNGDKALPTASAPKTATQRVGTRKKSHPVLSSPSQLGLAESTVSGVDFSHIRNWLSHCDGDIGHSDCRASTMQWRDLPGVQFRVIDVCRRCIVDAPVGCSFAVLSYVWGGVDQPKLTAETMSFLLQDGGLNTIWAKIPITIRDAITVCENIGIPHLWVDALCIRQDYTRDMSIQILRMRQIYAAAKCTIAAVSAETANDGLLGSSTLSGAPRHCRSAAILHTLINSSPWSDRAWCYQEKVLSHRAILFTSNGIYLQCQKGTYDSRGRSLAANKRRSRLTRFNTVGGMISVPPGEELYSYLAAVEQYSQRNLTKQEDKKNAFQAIFRGYGGSMDGKECTFFYGLPTHAFDQTLCWGTRQHNPRRRNENFPSWSWLGWNDAVFFDKRMIRTATTSQVIYGAMAGVHGEDTTELRKPAPHRARGGGGFGFPVSLLGSHGMIGTLTGIPELTICGSLANLAVASKPERSAGSNGIYAVFPTRCGEQPPSPPPPSRKVIVVESRPQPQPPPKPELIGAKTAAAPLPATHQTEEENERDEEFDTDEEYETEEEEYDPHEHDEHKTCLLGEKPLGYIWLDKEWREKQSGHRLMPFMALAGERSVRRKGKWTITMLMCLRHVKDQGILKSERVQVIDCRIAEEEWLRIGGKVARLGIV